MALKGPQLVRDRQEKFVFQAVGLFRLSAGCLCFGAEVGFAGVVHGDDRDRIDRRVRIVAHRHEQDVHNPFGGSSRRRCYLHDALTTDHGGPARLGLGDVGVRG